MRNHNALRVALATGSAIASLALLPAAALAQEKAPAAEGASDEGKAIIVTGSRIKQDPSRSALPLEIFTTETFQQNGISSPEQLNMLLSSNGSGADNLASNSDVTTGAQRGTNGLSAANLRGQGSGSTLILLNGRRVAAHGLSGSAVDVNQIPFQAIDRVEVLKDGASAIYGTDAIGGVINYITKKQYKGFGASALTDVTEQGGGNIYSVSAIAGYGDLKTQGFNIFASVAYRWNKALFGDERKFVNTNQPNRGLSVDTRGTPIATVFNIGANTFQTPGSTLTNSLTLTAPNGGNAAAGGINTLALPGGAGCTTMDGGLPYDYLLWNAPNNYYACAWDTGRATVLQQPIRTLTYYGRGTVEIGASEAYVEVTGSKAHSTKTFSNNQLSANTTSLPIAYPLNSLTASTYNTVFNSIRSAFAGNAAQVAALDARYGKPIAYRWRCIPCGNRQYVTDSTTFRVSGGVDGPLPFKGWDYRAGASYSTSEVSSVLGTGYFYRGTLANGSNDPSAPTAPGAPSPGIVGLLNSGILNPFSLTQTDAALAGLKSISADGASLYGGRYKVLQIDASASGPLFALPGGDAQLAFGVDYRRETYEFNGSAAAAATAPVIFNAAFDNVNALIPQHRNIKAAYAEVDLPVFDMLDLTGAVRIDDYTGFGSSVNPKFTARFTPTEWLMFRGSYSTGFRVPAFNQIFNGVTQSPYSGSDIVDPIKCPTLVANTTDVNCAFIRPDIYTGGNVNLGPEKSKELSFGVVVRPAPRWMVSADWWSINVDNTIQTLTLQQLLANATLFPDKFIRDSNGIVTIIDQRWINAGSRRTKGIEISARGAFDLGSNTISVGMDGSLLLKKIEKLTPNSAYGPSQIGIFTFAGDLGLKWKHNAWVTFSNKDIAVTLTQIFRNGYTNQALPGIAAGTVVRAGFNPQVNRYITYNMSATLLSLMPGYKLTFGVKNLFNVDPPFAITYDGNTGAGSSWEPRVADPRGRSFNVQVEVKF